jgi:hypothetical protein
MRCIRRIDRMSVTAQLEGGVDQHRNCVLRFAPAPRRGVVTMGSTEFALAYSERSLSVIRLLRWWR